jgi:pyruvate dehydrogenase E1 component alpha subunit
MDQVELQQWAERCPVKSFRHRLKTENVLMDKDFAAIDAEQEAVVEAAVTFGDDSPFPAAEDALMDLWINS